VEIIKRLTPINHWRGRDGHKVRAVVLHITDGDTAASAIDWFHNPKSEVSAHYVIDRDGTVYQVVVEDDTAWTNGPIHAPNLIVPAVRRWQQYGINPNKETISIEAAGTPATGWSRQQLDVGRTLARDICHRYGLTPGRDTIIGHRDIDSVNKARCPSLTKEQWQFMWETPMPETDFMVGEGVRAAMTQAGDVPVSNEMYTTTIQGQYSVTFGRDAIYFWDQASGTVQRVPK